MVNFEFARTARMVGPAVVTLIEGITGWSLALQGQVPLKRGLDSLMNGFDAEAAALVRIGRAEGSSTNLVVADPRSSTESVCPLEKSYASALLGRYMSCPKSGSVWLSSQNDTDQSTALRQFQRRRKLAELAVIIIGTEEKSVYLLELHFAQRLPSDAAAFLSVLADTLKNTWSNRAIGCFAEAALEGRKRAAAPATDATILSTGNPKRLSRAEFRVCLLLSAGLSTQRIIDELGISRSTLRSHLRQIYSKTETSNLADLLYRLLARPLGSGLGASPSSQIC